MAYTMKRESKDRKTGKTVTKYVGRYRVDGELKSTKTLPTKKLALEEAQAQERAGKQAEWIDPRLGEMTLSKWFTEWHEGRSDRASRTLESESERFASLIEPTFGKVLLKRLSHESIAKWATTMTSRNGEVASQARRRDAVRLMVQLLDAAVDARRLRTNPARTPSGKVPYLPKASKTKAHRYLTHEQLARVADAAPSDQARALILTAALTGLRWGEVSALKVSDLDMLRWRLKVTKAYTRLDDGTLELGDTKSHANRSPVVPSPARPLLAEQAAGKGKSDLLFADSNGEPLRRENFDRRSFRPAVHAAGTAVSALQALLGLDESAAGGLFDRATEGAVRAVQKRSGLSITGVCDPATWAVLVDEDKAHREGMTQSQKIKRTNALKAASRTTLAAGDEDFDTLTLHDLRHTAASLAIQSGATVKAVQSMLGHESAVLTLNTYAGLFPDDQDELADRLAAAFEDSAAHRTRTRPDEALAGVSVLPARNAG